jgi:hypothetical protein
MNQEQLEKLIQNLVSLPSETETVEFKENNFNKEEIQTTLLARIVDIQDNLSTHRSNNFIGQMLQHHHLKSTQYMAQWIEAKNR